MSWKKQISSLLLFAFSLAYLPFESLHHLFETHDTAVHVCNDDYCIRAQETSCDLCVITIKDLIHLTALNGDLYRYPVRTIKGIQLNSEISLFKNFNFARPPPIL